MRPEADKLTSLKISCPNAAAALRGTDELDALEPPHAVRPRPTMHEKKKRASFILNRETRPVSEERKRKVAEEALELKPSGDV